MVPFAIAGVQMQVPAQHNNIPAMVHKIDVAMARFPWVQMIVFSELATCGPVPGDVANLPGIASHALQKAAHKHGVWVVSGSIFEKNEAGELLNTAWVINPQGHTVARYSKMFPFRPYEHGVKAGTEFCVFDVPEVGRFGLSICYDMWVPETTRTLTSMGVEVLIHPVLTGTTDRNIELSIARATAAQFQCYVVDVNGLGSGGVGLSCVVDPSGTVLHQAGSGDEIFPIEIDLQQVRRQRETGIKGLGQVLKSYRDRDVAFTVYDPASGVDAYLHSLGPLAMPERGSRAGLEPRPAAAAPEVALDPAAEAVALAAPAESAAGHGHAHAHAPAAPEAPAELDPANVAIVDAPKG